MPHHVGVVVAERYVLEGVLGRGGQGVVYRAHDRSSGRAVAVKMLSDTYAHDPEYAARLAREQEALVALAGTSAVAVYDLCRAPAGALCLVMELLDGVDLEKVLTDLEARGEKLPLSRLSAIIDPIVDTLERAHDEKILHRDLKPANIFLLSDGEGVRLFDFGLSRRMASARLTLVGMVMGSPSYIAPEVWKGRSDELDTRVDVYSLGVILFRALSGRLPFEGTSLQDSLAKATTAPRPSLQGLRPDLPAAVDHWALRALAIDREERFATVTALWTSLLDALRYEPPPRARRPVADSLVNAWRAAVTAFRSFIPGARPTPSGESPRPSMPPSLPPDTRDIDDAWLELSDEEVETALAPPRSPLSDIDDAWEEVSDQELDRPSLFEAPAPRPRAPRARKPKTEPKATKKTGQKAAKRSPAGRKPAKAPKKKAAPKPKPTSPQPKRKPRKSRG